MKKIKFSFMVFILLLAISFYCNADEFQNGLYKSIDDGMTWGLIFQEYNASLPFKYFEKYAIQEFDGKTYLFAVSKIWVDSNNEYYSIEVSFDRGQIWTEISKVPSVDSYGEWINGVHVIKNDHGTITLYITKQRQNDKAYLYGGEYDPVANSIDWFLSTEIDGDMFDVEKIVNIDGVLFAKTYYAGLSRSFDDGYSWEQITLPIKNWIDPFTGIELTEGMLLANISSSKKNIYISLDYNGILKSSNSGDSWKQISKQLPDYRYGNYSVYHFYPEYCEAISNSNRELLYDYEELYDNSKDKWMGYYILKSSNKGKKWTKIKPKFSPNISFKLEENEEELQTFILFHPKKFNIAYLYKASYKFEINSNYKQCLYKSMDGGKKFKLITERNDLDLDFVVLDPVNPSILYLRVSE